MDIKMTNNDITFVDGDIVLTMGVAAIAQHLEQRLQVFLGEDVYARNNGVPYLQVVFDKNVPTADVVDVLTRVGLTVPGVLGISMEITVDRISRVATGKGTAQTIDGDVDFTFQSPQIGVT